MDNHKVKAIAVRVDQDTKDWLINTAKDEGMNLNAFMKKLISQQRYGYAQTKGQKDNG